jgi:hypothetical protein
VLIADLGARGGRPAHQSVNRCGVRRLCAAARGGGRWSTTTYASASARLDSQLVFNARPIGTRSREVAPPTAPRRRAGLRVVAAHGGRASAARAGDAALRRRTR